MVSITNLESTGLFIKYLPASKEETLQFIESPLTQFSTEKTDALKGIRKIIDFKDKHSRHYVKERLCKDGVMRTYMNIYSHILKIYIPKDKPVSIEIKDYLSMFLKTLDLKTYSLIWCYQEYQEKYLNYVKLLVFTTSVLEKPLKRIVSYKKDYWWDPVEKRQAKANVSGAVLRHKKGDPILDENGEVSYETVYVADKELPLFKYKKDGVISDGFEVMMERLKQLFLDVMQRLGHKVNKLPHFIKKVTYNKKKNKPSTLLKIVEKNRVIDSLNRKLLFISNGLIYGSMNESRFLVDEWNKLLRTTGELCHSDQITYAGITLPITYNCYLVTYKEKMVYLRALINKKLQDFYKIYAHILKEFYGFIPGDPYMQESDFKL
ncbi:hypothetical protein B7939_02240 [Eggerthia catenaformis]|nr:hypothetical protein B7939_02240 [Eggerthia catenaformis]